MNHGSPLSKDQRIQRGSVEVMLPFKKHKPVVGRGSAKRLVGIKCDSSQLFWIDRWLLQFVQSNSYPPSMAGSDPYSAMNQFLSPTDLNKVLTQIRSEFKVAFPHSVESSESESD